MRSTIDADGRVVIPKSMRESLGLDSGVAIDIRQRDGAIEIEPVPTPVHLEDREGGPVAVPEGELPQLTDELVRETLERSRR